MEIFVRKGPWSRKVFFVLMDGDRFVRSVETEKLEAGAEIPPTAEFALEPNAAQGLVDELWRVGFRPSEAMGSAGSMRATEKHLDDMRKIVSKSLGMEL